MILNTSDRVIIVGNPGVRIVSAGRGGAQSYSDIVLGVQSANLIAYWPLNETSGTNADNAEGTAARDGTYSGVTLNAGTGPFGGPAGLWNGTSSTVKIYSASFAAAFNGGEVSMQAWIKITDWSNTGFKYAYRVGETGSSNLLQFVKPAAANFFRVQYGAGGTFQTVSLTPFSPAGWFHVVITVSKSNNRMRCYINGSQSGTDQTGLGVWAGTLTDAGCRIGDYPSASYFAGYENHCAIWATELTAANVTTLYNGGPTA